MLEVETYRQLAETALDRAIASVASPDAWFLKGAATAPALRRALVGHRFVAPVGSGSSFSWTWTVVPRWGSVSG